VQVDPVAVLDHELTVAQRHDPDVAAESSTSRGVALGAAAAVVVWEHEHVGEAQARELEFRRRRERGRQAHRLQRRTGDDRPGAVADIHRSGRERRGSGLPERRAPRRRQQVKRIATGDRDDIGGQYGGTHGARGLAVEVDPFDGQARAGELLLDLVRDPRLGELVRGGRHQ
jgi:hypothetical protein